MNCTTYTPENCRVDETIGCGGAYAKTKLPPLKVTASTAKIGVIVPRDSMIENPLSSGWSMKVRRAGTKKIVAEYTIAEYDSSQSKAIFFVDDALRKAENGYYLASVEKDCCAVASIVMAISCPRATSYDVQNFTHDPQPEFCAPNGLKPAECKNDYCKTMQTIDPCANFLGDSSTC